MPRIIDRNTGRYLGTLTDEECAQLMALFEESTRSDEPFPFDPALIDDLAESGAARTGRPRSWCGAGLVHFLFQAIDIRHPGAGRDPATFFHLECKALGPGLRRDDGFRMSDIYGLTRKR